MLQVRIGKKILVATMASKVHCYSGKGERAYTLTQPAPIVGLQLVALQNTRATRALLVALANGGAGAGLGAVCMVCSS